MSQTALRPRYRFSSANEPKELWALVKAAMANRSINTYGFEHRAVANHFIINYPKRHHHFWSPTIDLSFTKSAKEQTNVRVLFGPEPAIWTMFMFGYSVAGLAILGGLVLGYSQYILGHSAWLFWLAPLGVFLLLLLLLASYFGKHQAQEQTLQLKHFLESAFNHALKDDVG